MTDIERLREIFDPEYCPPTYDRADQEVVNLMHEAIREILSDYERLREMEADAKRYRWLRGRLRVKYEDGFWWTREMEEGVWSGAPIDINCLDTAIDAAMGQTVALVPVPGGE